MRKIMKPGQYYIGDPTYVFDPLGYEWQQNMGCAFYDRDKTIFGGGTMYGDSIYYDKKGRTFWVDSGCLALIPVEMLLIDNTAIGRSVVERGGAHIVTFKRGFSVSSINGVFTFGNIVINTDTEEMRDAWAKIGRGEPAGCADYDAYDETYTPKREYSFI